MPGLTRAAIAERAGCSRQAVHKALQRGHLTAGPDGLIDPAAAENRSWLSHRAIGFDGIGRLPGRQPQGARPPAAAAEAAEEPEREYLIPEQLPELDAILAASEREWGHDYLSRILEPSGPPAPKLFEVWEGLRFDPAPGHELVSVLFNGHNKPFCLTVIFIEALRQKVGEQLELIRASQAQALKALRSELAALAWRVTQLEACAETRKRHAPPGRDH